jgi:methionyl-tRNA synthetase
MDLRIGEIVAADPVPGSDRLLKLSVDLCGETRTLVGGLARSHTPEQLQGLQVAVVANMAPATIRGIRSEGMLLGVQCGTPETATLLTVERRVETGAPVA